MECQTIIKVLICISVLSFILYHLFNLLEITYIGKSFLESIHSPLVCLSKHFGSFICEFKFLFIFLNLKSNLY